MSQDTPSQTSTLRKVPRPIRVVAITLLFSGAALVLHIVTGVSLALGILVGAVIVAGVATVVWRASDPQRRRSFLLHLRVGVVAAIAATIVYDVIRVIIANIDPARISPFEAFRAFGIGLVGEGLTDGALFAVGVGVHALNGITFGVAYCLLFGRRGPLAGVIWSLALTLFQVGLYPGWLDVAAYRPFVTMSVVGHIAYGVVLGWICRRMLQRADAGAPSEATDDRS